MSERLGFNALVRAAASTAVDKGFRKVKLAILGDSTTQFLHRAILSAGKLKGIDFEIWEADYDQIEMQVLAPGTEFHAFEADIVLVSYTSHKLRQKFYKTDREGQGAFFEGHLEKMRELYAALAQRNGVKVVFTTLEEQDDAVYGHFGTQVPQALIYHLRRINVGLMDLAASADNLFLLDIASMSARWGREQAFTPSIYVNTDLVHSLDFTAEIARALCGIVDNLLGRFKKCLILDLDNTLWGGVIGDDGLEGIALGGGGLGKAFVEFQLWVKQLQMRGIILAVCSKNTDSIAREPFEKHPDMVLSLDDIAVFVANWENKADNIRYIQEVLNIGFDSMVFLDDNPAERQIVRENVPDVTVPELPEDPALYVEHLVEENLFETVSHSKNDAQRTKQYQQEAHRKQASRRFTDVGDFLRSLEMKAFVRPFRAVDIPRVAQLSQRSNQFNLRTVRYTEGDVKEMTPEKGYHTFAFNLEDKFGAHGLICLVILQERDRSLFIDTWIMSCRVLKRGMEHFVLGQLVAHARENGFSELIGEYLPTAKNGIVKDHYRDLGFEESGGKWILPVEEYQSETHFIAPTIEKQ